MSQYSARLLRRDRAAASSLITSRDISLRVGFRNSSGMACAPRNVGTNSSGVSLFEHRGSRAKSSAHRPSTDRNRTSLRRWSCRHCQKPVRVFQSPAASSSSSVAARVFRTVERMPPPLAGDLFIRRSRAFASRIRPPGCPANTGCACASTKPGRTTRPAGIDHFRVARTAAFRLPSDGPVVTISAITASASRHPE